MKILGVNFGNCILDNCKWNKKRVKLSQKIHIWNRVRLSLRGKKIIVNETLLSKLQWTGKICTIPKYTKKYIPFPPEQEKNTTSQTPSSTIHLDEVIRHFRHRDTTKLSKNKMDSKVIMPHQCFLEKPYAVSIEFNSEL